jgi:hypothetical protein
MLAICLRKGEEEEGEENGGEARKRNVKVLKKSDV